MIDDYRALLAERDRRRARSDPWYWIPHQPHPKQSEFLALDCLEALYGGAAGGGKSDALLMAAIQYVHVPGYAALILRRTYTDLALPGAIMDRAKTWLIPKGVPWNDKEKRFTFPSGATLTFGHLDTDQDRFRYQGVELQFVGFDELTQFPEVWYRYLLSRLRRLEGSTTPVRARSASNPGGIGHDWVYRRFITPGDPDRAFVPATLADNPHLDREQYAKSLAQLDPTTRKQLEQGIWIRDANGLVYEHFDIHRNAIREAPECSVHLLAVDFGVTNDCGFSVLGWRPNDPVVYVLESYRMPDMIPSTAAEEIQKLDAIYHFARMVGDVGGLGKGFAEEARRRFSLPIEPAQKQNKRGYISLFNGELARGRIVLVRSKTLDLQSEYVDLPWDEKRLKEASGFANHAADATLYGWREASAYHEQELREGPKPSAAEAADAMAKELEEAALRSIEQEPGSDEWDGLTGP